ncbi:hypothetical protein Unana1_06089 [Umbelopsis nana]
MFLQLTLVKAVGLMQAQNGAVAPRAIKHFVMHVVCATRDRWLDRPKLHNKEKNGHRNPYVLMTNLRKNGRYKSRPYLPTYGNLDLGCLLQKVIGNPMLQLAQCRNMAHMVISLNRLPHPENTQID